MKTCLQLNSSRILFWAGEVDPVTFQLRSEVKGILTVYDLILKAEADQLFLDEELSVNNVKVISILDKKLAVGGGDSRNEAINTSYKLALGSTECKEGDITDSVLKEFIKTWEFYDFQPGRTRRLPEGLEQDELSEHLKPGDVDSAFSAISKKSSGSTQYHVSFNFVEHTSVLVQGRSRAFQQR